MAWTSLTHTIQDIGDPVTMLRSPKHGSYEFPTPGQCTDWRHEREMRADRVSLKPRGTQDGLARAGVRRSDVGAVEDGLSLAIAEVRGSPAGDPR